MEHDDDKTILIVDPRPDELAGLLSDEGHELAIATTGAEARSTIAERGGEIGVVLLDWRLPDCDGVDLLGWIKEQPGMQDVEVIIESAEMISGDIRTGIDRGAYYYLTKPYVPTQLRAIVRGALGACDLRRDLESKIRETEDTCRLLEQGTFRVRTFHEAELLAIHLGSACADPQKGVGLHELLLNAIEHGNLGIGYDEKSRLAEEGGLDAERKRRLELPDNRDKAVRVELVREAQRLVVEITDCGDGFDYRRFQAFDRDRMLDAHGRGVMMASALLDLEYLGKGNRVRVLLPVPDDAGEPGG